MSRKNTKKNNVLYRVKNIDDMNTITITLDKNSIKQLFLDLIKEASKGDEKLLNIARLYFISQSLEQESDQAIAFLADVGLLSYLENWNYLLPEQVERVETMLHLQQKNQETL